MLLYYLIHWQAFISTYMLCVILPLSSVLDVCKSWKISTSQKKQEKVIKVEACKHSFSFLSGMGELKFDLFYLGGLFCQIHHLLIYRALWAASRHV